MNTEDFVTYEQALALKKLGFIEDCTHYYQSNILYDKDVFAYYKEHVTISKLSESFNNIIIKDDVCDAPTLAQVQKWFRVKHKQSIEPTYDETDWNCMITDMTNGIWTDLDNRFNSYEEALSTGITECLKLLEND